MFGFLGSILGLCLFILLSSFAGFPCAVLCFPYVYTQPWPMALEKLPSSESRISLEAAERQPGQICTRPGHKIGFNVYFWPKMRRSRVPLQPTGLLMFFWYRIFQTYNIFRKKHSKSRALTSALSHPWVSEQSEAESLSKEVELRKTSTTV